MRHPLHVILATLGLRRQKPKTNIARAIRHTENTIAVTGVLYLALIFFPHALFAGYVDHGPLRIHHRATPHAPNTAPIQPVLERAHERLKASEVYDANETCDIFACNDYGLYAFFNPKARHALGAAYAVTDNAFLAMTDFELDRSYRRAGDVERSRVLSQVIAHEATHLMLSRRLGFFAYMRLPAWKNEGYCEVVSRGHSPNLAAEIRAWNNDEDKHNITNTYRRNRLLIDYLVTVKGMTFLEVAADKSLELESVQTEMLAWSRARTNP
ncbi:MAG: hypothetical protein ACYTGQ_12180 [Planctomycetota bacterium]|jgi:hypothetical protein